jgi:hypothetical protein
MAHPYIAQRLAEDHRGDLLRSAAAWRLAHPLHLEETTPAVRQRPVLSRLLGRPIVTLVLRGRARCDSTTALCACSCPPPR